MTDLRVNRCFSRLWKKHADDLGVVSIAAVLGYAFFMLLIAVSAASGQFAKAKLPSIDVILFVFPEDPMVVVALPVAVGLMIVIGWYAEVRKVSALMGMMLISVGLFVAAAGIAGLLFPHVYLLSTLNGPSPSYAGAGDSSWVDDLMWGLASVGMVVSALPRKKMEIRRRAGMFYSRFVIDTVVALSVTGFTWSLLQWLASSEVLLEIGLGGQRLPYLTEQVMWAAPNSVRGRAIVTVCVGIITWVGLAKRPFGRFPRYFSGVALTIFLFCCVILVFMVVPYYQLYAADIGASAD